MSVNKVYISCHCPVLAEQAAQVIRAAGHQVVSTWHADSKTPKPTTDAEWRRAASRSFSQIGSADEFVLIAHPTEKVTGSKFIELGYAEGLGSGVRSPNICIIGRYENGLAHWFAQLDTIEEHVEDWLDASEDCDLDDEDDE